MYIHEIIVDGFKSYPTRQVIGPFDRHFNATTGANGSGKSNSLDAILFAMGLTDYKLVRATGLKDLIYKQGQAGVTKASVTVVFNNEDKAHSPDGYEDCDFIHLSRQIQVGGTSKQLINGKVADSKRVQALLHSQQLNINNPHFLIMQGRVTKVLNMKPQEVLNMIAEAAGTRMYDEKKSASLKQIEKKDKKLEEIEQLLQEEIMPQLQKLHEERSAYLEYQKAQGEIETLEHFVGAYQFTEAKQRLEQLASDLENLVKEQKEKERRQANLVTVLEDKKTIMEGLRRKRDEEAGAGLKDLEEGAGKLSKDLVQVTSALDNLRRNAEAEAAAKEQLLQSVQQNQGRQASIAAAVAAVEQECSALQQAHSAAQAALDAVQRRLQAVQAGMADEDEGASFQDKIRELNNVLSTAVTEKKQAEMKLKHSQAELKKKKPLAQEAEKAHAGTAKQLEAREKELATLRAQLDSMQVDPQAEPRLQKEKVALEREVQQLQGQVDQMAAKMANLQFSYSDPEPGFDRSTVHGLVARLVAVKNPNTTTALEVTAGGKLYNVIVDTQETGSKLLQKGKLQQRVTIIPLNKVAASSISPDKIAAARREVGPDNAVPAISLVGYPEEVERAMQFVFGGTFVCKDPASAQKVTYNPSIRTRCVTIDGDVYEPSGTLSGGARAQGGSVLTRLQQLKEAEDALNEAKQRLNAITAEYAKALEAVSKYRKLAQQLELKEHELQLLNETIRSSTHHQQLQELRDLETDIAKQAEKIAAAEKQEKEAKANISKLQQQEKEFTSSRDGALKRIEAEIKEQKKAVASTLKTFKAKEQEAIKLRAEMEQQSLDMASVDGQVADQDRAMAQINKDIQEKEARLAALQREYQEAQDRLKERRNKMAATDKELRKATEEHGAANDELEQLAMDLRQAGHRRKTLEKDRADTEATVASLYRQHKWIADEEQFFGQADSKYDFSKRDVHQAKATLQKLKQENARREKNINTKAMAQFQQKDTEYNELVSKKSKVDKDKEKILASIKELDKKKEEQLEKTAHIVNGHFGKIFSTLLPGTQCKLATVDERNVQEGLEIKVAFGSVWKQSLAELSGGQKSLVALSLILAMLLFKPAPVYILDEVDAALDISHTQNIGRMIKTHFTHSQFIVVSLKDNLFNHANVVFKTQFIDGASTIARFANNTENDEDNSTRSAARGKAPAQAKASAKPLSARNRP